ncbi:MAG: hypothetical protein ACNA8G_13375 [Gammaproteobacteria bacterium]
MDIWFGKPKTSLLDRFAKAAALILGLFAWAWVLRPSPLMEMFWLAAVGTSIVGGGLIAITGGGQKDSTWAVFLSDFVYVSVMVASIIAAFALARGGRFSWDNVLITIGAVVVSGLAGGWAATVLKKP